jgi:HK97 family phage prohead protease
MNNPTPERRAAALERREIRFQAGVELRMAAAGSDSPGTLVGYAAVFGKLSEDLGGFREMIRPGAFDRSIKSAADVLALVNHDDDDVLGRSTAGTLRLATDEVGLRVEIDLPDTTAGRDTAVSVARRDLQGMSFAFYTLVDQWDFSGSTILRDLVDVDLVDVSVVARPAYTDTSVAVRSLERARSDRKTPAPAASAIPPAIPAPAPPAAPVRLHLDRDRLRLAESA